MPFRTLRAPALLALGVAGVPAYLALARASGDLGGMLAAFGWLLALTTALGVAGAALVWRSIPLVIATSDMRELAAIPLVIATSDMSQQAICRNKRYAGTGGARWLEMGIIAAVGLAWRAELWPLAPALSADVYRYVWDAQLLLHGVSPYLHTPNDPALAALRDGTIWPRLAWRDVPTIYPPGAEGLFALVGWLAPLNLWAMKAAIALGDGATFVLTALLLHRRGLDPRRAILYWWSPLPVLEFALNGHVDAVAVALTLGAVLALGGGTGHEDHESPRKLANTRQCRGLSWNVAAFASRPVAAGVLLGLAALVKIYPLLFVVALVRRGERAPFVAATAGTVALGYLALAPLGLGGGGFLGTYFSQRFVDQGLLHYWLGLGLVALHAPPAAIALAPLAALGAILGGIVLWRWRAEAGRAILALKGQGTDAAIILAISAAWMAVAPHVLPWYVASVLPFLALVPTRAPALAVLATSEMLFVLLAPFTYILFALSDDPAHYQWFWLAPLAVALAVLATRELLAARRVRALAFQGPDRQALQGPDQQIMQGPNRPDRALAFQGPDRQAPPTVTQPTLEE